MAEAIKIATKGSTPNNIQSIIERQAKLVVLNSKFFPESIVENFHELKVEQLSRPRVNYANVNMHELLEGARYVREKKNENESSIFKQIDRINKTSLF